MYPSWSYVCLYVPIYQIGLKFCTGVEYAKISNQVRRCAKSGEKLKSCNGGIIYPPKLNTNRLGLRTVIFDFMFKN